MTTFVKKPLGSTKFRVQTWRKGSVSGGNRSGLGPYLLTFECKSRCGMITEDRSSIVHFCLPPTKCPASPPTQNRKRKSAVHVRPADPQQDIPPGDRCRTPRHFFSAGETTFEAKDWNRQLCRGDRMLNRARDLWTWLPRKLTVLEAVETGCRGDEWWCWLTWAEREAGISRRLEPVPGYGARRAGCWGAELVLFIVRWEVDSALLATHLRERVIKPIN